MTTYRVNKNDELEAEVIDLTHEGSGVCKVEDYPIFVPHALPGETIKLKVVKTNKRYGFGKLLEVITASKERVTPPCPVYGKCGGCQLQHMSPGLQSEMKKSQIEHLLQKTAHLPDVLVNEVETMENPWHYRNKVQMPVGEKEGKVITGFYQARSHRIIDDMDNCLIQQEISNDILKEIRRLANDFKIRPYDEKRHIGDLRHIVIRTGYHKDEVMVTFVTKSNQLKMSKQIVKQLTDKFPQITSIQHNVNKKRSNVVLGDQTTVLYGEAYMYDELGDLTFAISQASFYQVNPPQTEKLYHYVLDYAGLTGEETVIDAYCGIGTISLFLAEKAKKVYGIEVIEAAVEDANMNARENKISNAEFRLGLSEEVMLEMKEEGIQPDVIVIDPPRKGADHILLETMLEMNPEKIIYVSCNPATLARDLVTLKEAYELKEVQPVDLFPQTHHIETVVLLSRKK